MGRAVGRPWAAYATRADPWLALSAVAALVALVAGVPPAVDGLLGVGLISTAAAAWIVRAGRQRQTDLARIAEFAIAQEAVATPDALHQILLRTAALVGTRHAYVVVVGETSVRRLGAGLDEQVHDPVEVETWRAVHAAHRIVRCDGGSQDAVAAGLLPALGWADCLITPLAEEPDLAGVLVVADRLAPGSTYGATDERLLRAAAARVSALTATDQLLARLRYETRHDPLTGLVNRSAFRQELASLATDQQVSVLLLDLDRFKDVNDTLGHHHGDLLIALVADRLREAVPPEAVVARLGGDEFAVLLPGFDGPAAHAVALQVSSAIARPSWVDGVLLDVQSSIGLAISPDHARVPAELLKLADTAMYSAKQADKPVEFYDRRHDRHSPRRLALASRLRTAAEDGHLVLEYQPQVGIGDGRVVGVEALMRWHHPEYGHISPVEFIPVAERSGAISTMSHWALSTAVSQAASWRDDGIELEVSINLSMRNLGDGSIAEHLRVLLDQHRLDPRLLTLEVTESQIMGDPDRTRQTLRALADIGVSLSIDDFGTGYSSLAYLRQLPVHEVKIDRSFMAGLATGRQETAIVKAITDLAQALSMRVVAEGVEDLPTLQRLDSLGCDRAQGFLFSRSLAADDIAPWIAGQQPYLPRIERLAPVATAPAVDDDRTSYLMPAPSRP
jgi:diguanylate cyclase (GGDEF)-like protein